MTFGRPSKVRDDNIKMDLKGVGCEDGRWMEVTGDRRIVSACSFSTELLLGIIALSSNGLRRWSPSPTGQVRI